jgi:hypothetical protein
MTEHTDRFLNILEVECGGETHRIGIDAILTTFEVLGHDAETVAAFTAFGAAEPVCYHVKDQLDRAVNAHKGATWWIKDQMHWPRWARTKVLNQLKRAMVALVLGDLKLAVQWAEDANKNAVYYRHQHEFSSEPRVDPPTRLFLDYLDNANCLSQGIEP